MTFEKVMVNMPSAADRLKLARDRLARIEPLSQGLGKHAECVRTLLTLRFLGPSGVRVLQHLNGAVNELDVEATMTRRAIAALEEEEAKQTAAVSATEELQVSIAKLKRGSGRKKHVS